MGNLIARLIEKNILMWHVQETVYVGDLDSMSREELLAYLKNATRLNLERNAAIDKLDAHVEGALCSLLI
jgi:thiamine pyrophosphokinase